MQEVVKKDTRFKPGQSGNPAGRPKGSKNKSTQIRKLLEEKLTNKLQKDALAILDKAIEMAKNGDRSMIKLLIEKMLPTPKAVGEDMPRGTGGITIVVQPMQSDNSNVVEGEVIKE